jgi:hypothetical protein
MKIVYLNKMRFFFSLRISSLLNIVIAFFVPFQIAIVEANFSAFGAVDLGVKL